MLNKKEIILIFVITIILALATTLIQSTEIFLYALLAIFIVILINITAKKIVSFYLDSEIEIKLWEFQRYGFKTHEHFKKPFPAGAFFPLISKIIFFPLVGFAWMASLIFEVKPKIYKAAKRHGLYSFSEVTEGQLGIIASAGIILNILAAIVGYLIGFPEFSKLSIYYAFFNLIPISNLDGNKIFFGNIVLWSFLATITSIGLFFALFII
jgi:hypothetical protein